MKVKILFSAATLTLLCSSCFKFRNGGVEPEPPVNTVKVWGYKPVYGTEPEAKQILYTANARPVVKPGNIYAYHTYLFQMDEGRGIHVIDNRVPANATRIGFIDVKGCSQISIKDSKLYTNSYDDLVVLDVSDLANVKEYSRLKGVFTEYRYYSPLATPPGRGYYECPNGHDFVVGWKRDSVNQYCYQN